MEKALRDLIAAAKIYHQAIVDMGEIMDVDRVFWASICKAEESLRNGGWKKWPDEKPTDHDYYIVRRLEAGRFKDVQKYIGEGFWHDLQVEYWQPFPPLPKEG